MEQTNKKWVMSGLMIGTFLTAIEGTIVSTAMPKIVSALHGIQLMDWVFAIFLLASAVTVPLFGKLSDLFGRKRIFNIGASFFLVGSVLCGVSQTMGQLIIFRAVQGIGAGAVMTVSTTIIGDIFPIEKRAKMFGLIGMIWGIAGIFGPLAGGFFVDQLSWHWIFFINIPFGILAVLMVGFALKERPERTKQSVDYWGASSFAVGMAALLYGLQKAGEGGGWLSPGVLSAFTVFILFIIIFFMIERRAAEPMMPLDLFSNPVVALANGLALIASGVLIGLTVYMPMWLQALLGFSATGSGFVLTPMSITWMAGSFLCGHLLRKMKLKGIGFIGTGLLAIGGLWLSCLSLSSARLSLYLLTALLGLSFGLIMTSTMVCVQSAVGYQMRGAATASNQFFRNLGQTVGAAVFGTSFNTKVSGEIVRYQAAGEKISTSQLNGLIRPGGISYLPGKTVHLLRQVLEAGIHHVFFLLFLISVAGVIAAFFLPGRGVNELKSKIPRA